MVKHTQTIRWQFADESFSVWRFCGVGAERVKMTLKKIELEFYWIIKNIGIPSAHFALRNYSQNLKLFSLELKTKEIFNPSKLNQWCI